MLSRTVLPLFLAAFSFLPFFSAEAAPSDSGTDKVIVVVIDAMDIDTFTSPEWRHLRALVDGGVIGLMNSRTAPTPSATVSAAAHVTIGAGVRAPATAVGGLNFGTDESVQGGSAGALYEAVTGRPAPENGVVVLGFEAIVAAARGQPEGAQPGRLGERIAQAGGRIAIIGNADAPPTLHESGFAPDDDPRLQPRRHGALLAMDRTGRVPLGVVDQRTLTEDVQWPLRWRTDYDAVWRFFIDVLEDADVVVVELGDFARLDALGEWIPSERRQWLRREMVQQIDAWLGKLAAWPDAAGSTVVVLTPSPPAAAARESLWLTPFAAFPIPVEDAVPVQEANPFPEDGAPLAPGEPPDRDSVHPRLATSRTTRRAGIVANTDVAAFVLDTWKNGAAPDELPIRPAAAGDIARDVPPTRPLSPDGWETVALLYERAVQTYKLRPAVVHTFVTAAIVLFVGAAVGMGWDKWTGRDAFRRRLHIWQIPLLLLCSAPLAMLLLPLFPGAANSAVFLVILTAALAGCFFLSGRLGRIRWVGARGDNGAAHPGGIVTPYVTASVVTAIAIVLDAWFGSPLMKSSVLGFDPIVGARYYGIGNEYMGVLLGTSLVGIGGWLDGRPGLPHRPGGRLFVTALYGVVCVTLASPALGANVGGTVAAAVGCAVAAMLLWREELSWKSGLAAALTAIALLAGAGALDLLRGEARASHLGQTILLFQSEGIGPLASIVYRKIAMNIKLLRWTIWAQVFLVSFALLTTFLLRFPPSGPLQRRHPRLFDGIRSAVLGAFAALLANDSGIVAAATAMIPVTATFMHVALSRPVGAKDAQSRDVEPIG